MEIEMTIKTKETKEDLQAPVPWEDFLALATKVRQQEELIKIAFENCDILRAEIKELKKLNK